MGKNNQAGIIEQTPTGRHHRANLHRSNLENPRIRETLSSNPRPLRLDWLYPSQCPNARLIVPPVFQCPKAYLEKRNIEYHVVTERRWYASFLDGGIWQRKQRDDTLKIPIIVEWTGKGRSEEAVGGDPLVRHRLAMARSNLFRENDMAILQQSFYGRRLKQGIGSVSVIRHPF